MGSNTEKKSRTYLRQLCYRKVERAITKGGAIEKSPILNEEFELTYPISPFKIINVLAVNSSTRLWIIGLRNSKENYIKLGNRTRKHFDNLTDPKASWCKVNQSNITYFYFSPRRFSHHGWYYFVFQPLDIISRW